MSAIIRAELGLELVTRTQSMSPIWVSETQLPEPSPLLPIAYIGRKLESGAIDKIGICTHALGFGKQLSQVPG